MYIIIKGLALQTQSKAVYKVCSAGNGFNGGVFFWFVSDGLCMGVFCVFPPFIRCFVRFCNFFCFWKIVNVGGFLKRSHDVKENEMSSQDLKRLQVSLRVQKGVLSVLDVQEGEQVDGQNEKHLSISSSNLQQLNDLLSRVSYTSTIYHIKTQDLGV